LISLLAAELALLSVGRRVCGRVRRDLGLSARQHLLRRNESDGGTCIHVAIDNTLYDNDVTGEICTKWNERESTWRKSGSCRSRGTKQSRS
jgi:hypothetical protein